MQFRCKKRELAAWLHARPMKHRRVKLALRRLPGWRTRIQRGRVATLVPTGIGTSKLHRRHGLCKMSFSKNGWTGDDIPRRPPLHLLTVHARQNEPDAARKRIRSLQPEVSLPPSIRPAAGRYVTICEDVGGRSRQTWRRFRPVRK